MDPVASFVSSSPHLTGSPAAFFEGDIVRVTGLTSAAQYNGVSAHVIAPINRGERWSVKLEYWQDADNTQVYNKGSVKILSLKTDNLELLCSPARKMATVVQFEIAQGTIVPDQDNDPAPVPVGGEGFGRIEIGYKRVPEPSLQILLARAAWSGKPKAVELVCKLLERGAKPTYFIGSVGPGGRPTAVSHPTTPLFAACQMRDTKLARLLLEAKAHPDIGSLGNMDPWLHVRGAAKHMNEAAMMAHTQMHGLRDTCTPLIMAAEENAPAIVKLLLQAGANCNERDSTGQSALHMAATGGCLEALKVLVEAGAEINTPSAKGQSALSSAAGEGAIDCVRFLCSLPSIDVDAGEPCAFYQAVVYARWDVACLLAAHGADIAHSRGGSGYGFMPLPCLCSSMFGGQDRQTALLLVQLLGCDLSAQGPKGMTAIHALLTSAHRDGEAIAALAKLVAAGADPAASTTYWGTPGKTAFAFVSQWPVALQDGLREVLEKRNLHGEDRQPLMCGVSPEKVAALFERFVTPEHTRRMPPDEEPTDAAAEWPMAMEEHLLQASPANGGSTDNANANANYLR